MKRLLKIIISIVMIIIAVILLDSLQANLFKNSPVISWRKELDSYSYVDRGILVNTYNCKDNDIVDVRVYPKGTKFTCPVTSKSDLEVKEIVDTTKDIKDFTCAEALEEFYEDDKYVYYYNCIKSKYIIVRYMDGHEETVRSALKNGTITIKDLDKYNIDYIKYDK